MVWVRGIASGRRRVAKSSADVASSYATTTFEHRRMYLFHHCHRFRFCGYAATSTVTDAAGTAETADAGMFNSVKLQ